MPGTAQTIRVRPTARILLLDPADRLLLFQFEDPDVSDPVAENPADRSPVFWVTPGGGLEDGETFEEAAIRELREETGLRECELGPCLHYREKSLLLNATETLFQERYFLARTATPAISLDGLFGIEATTFRQYRWWSLAEIEQTSEVIFPENLPEMLRPLIEAGSGE